MKLLDDTNQYIKDTLKGAEDERAELQKTLEEDNADAEAAREEMSRATDAGDLPAYQAARAKLQDAEIGAEMHKARLEKITGRPLISEDDYNARVNDITKAIQTEDREARDRLCTLAEEMNQISAGLEKDINSANACLHRLQYDIYQCADVPRKYYNDSLVLEQDEKKIRNYDTVKFGKCGVTHFVYKNTRGGK